MEKKLLHIFEYSKFTERNFLTIKACFSCVINISMKKFPKIVNSRNTSLLLLKYYIIITLTKQIILGI